MTQDLPTVSVIIPAYGHESYILDALESVFQQTFSDYEVIVVNDGSPDGTAMVLQPSIRKGRIRYIEQSNSGQSSARNRGLREAKGEFIAFLDDDDLWPADKLEWQVEYLQSHPDVVMIAGGAEYINEHGESVGKNTPLLESFSVESLFSHHSLESPGQTLIRTTALREIGGFQTDIWGAEDLCLYFDLARRGAVHASPRIALLYRLHATNASHNQPRMFENTWRVFQRQLERIPRERAKALRRTARIWLYNYIGRTIARELIQFKGGMDWKWWKRRIPVLKEMIAWTLVDHAIRERIVREVIRPRISQVLRRRPGVTVHQ